MAAVGLDEVMDPAQLKRIEAVHRGFLYQHVFAAGCLLLMPAVGTEAVIIEHDEDVEVVGQAKHLYVQVKTRNQSLVMSDISDALVRFTRLREEHVTGRRSGEARFGVIANVSPGPELTRALSAPSWPPDVSIWWPGNSGDEWTPPAWPDVDTAVHWCVNAAGSIPFKAVQPDTLIWKLAARVQYVATGHSDHRILASELPGLFEQIVLQLQDFPSPPALYRPQINEPDFSDHRRVRLVLGFSGAGKTAWASQAAVHSETPSLYFDVGDLPGAAVAQSVARELAARFFGGRQEGLGGALLPFGSGHEVLRAVNRKLDELGLAVTVVLDNVHRVSGSDLRELTEWGASLRFICIGQPWQGAGTLEALLQIEAETLDGWAPDTIAAEFAAATSRIDPAGAARLRTMTGGMPLFVQNAARLTRDLFNGDANAFLAAIEGQTHPQSTAQEVILREAFTALPAPAKDLAAILSVADVPLRTDEIAAILGPLSSIPVAPNLRELGGRWITQTFEDGMVKLHDAFRPLAGGHAETLPPERLNACRAVLRDRLLQSFEEGHRTIGRLSLWMRLLAQTDQVNVLADLTTSEMFHEFGDPSGLKQVLEAAAASEDLTREDRFWALDGLAFWDAQDRTWEKLPDRIREMRQLVEQGGLGEREEVSLLMKEMISAGRAQNLRAVETVYAFGAPKARQQDPSIWRVFKYNHALALFHAGAYTETAQSAQELAIEYYDLLGIWPQDALAKNPAEILSMLPDTPTREDDLKHLADCLHLYSRACRETGEETRLADIHAMKFYVMANAMKSAAAVGQDVVDSFIGHGDAVGARIVLEQHILPLVRAFGLTELLLQVRGQYAVVLAYCGEVDRAKDEMRALEAYDASTERSEELQNQRMLIGAIDAGDVRLPQRALPPSRSRIMLPTSAKVGRNEPCPCGSGVKYKRCHGR